MTEKLRASVGLTGDDLTLRLHAIAANAVQAAREALGRGFQPATDNDMLRQFAIAKQLQLDTDPGESHRALAAAVEPAPSISDVQTRDRDVTITPPAPWQPQQPLDIATIPPFLRAGSQEEKQS